MMPYGQYLRIERKAGGVSASPRQFVKAAHTLLAPSGRSRENREKRHAWLRYGLAQLKKEYKTFIKYRF